MGKEWGLTLDCSPPLEFSANKPAIGFSLSPRLSQYKGSSMIPLNLNCREGKQTAVEEKTMAVGEVDFFADTQASIHKSNDISKTGSGTVIVKKENLHNEDDKLTGFQLVNTGLNLLTTNTGCDQSTVDDGILSDPEEKRARDELAQLQVELERMNEENQRLKEMLSQVSSNYGALRTHLSTLMHQQQSLRTENKQEYQILESKSEQKKADKEILVPRQFLELGPSSTAEKNETSNSSSEERTISGSPPNNKDVSKKNNHIDGDQAIGNGREESPDSESWVPNKVPKLTATETVDQAAEATMRKARVSVRARSEAPMITDGCQWRKYGQKMAKGNPCPRAYYRCTMAVGCPVRKQVQRCAEDQTILITTYEGTHNHPLPPAAVAMASTTSAAATMLLSGSMSSADGLMNPNFLARAILPCSSSMATISASAPFPTVTLDLTHNTNPLQFQRPTTHFQVPFSCHPQNFAAVPNPSMAQVLGQTLYNQSKFSGLQVSQGMEPNQVPLQSPPQQMLQRQNQTGSFADTLGAATAAIAADPNFTAALAAAITSIIGGSQPNNNSKNITTNTATTTSSSSAATNVISGNNSFMRSHQ